MMSRSHSEDGSIPLVLTVIILVGGIVAALVAVVIGTQRSVTFDRNYAEAITAADAGLQQALTFLSQQDTNDPIGTEYTEEHAAGGGNSLGDAEFEWTATKEGPLRWEVRASGTARDVTRVVESTIAADTEFWVAAFSDLGITFRGGNGADSYPAGGHGAIGSNNAITMNGNSYADFIFLYGSATCSGAGCDTGTTDGHDEEINMDEIREVVAEEHKSECEDEGRNYSSWTASDFATDGVVELEPGHVICATDVVFDTDVVITDPSQDNPVKILATGDIRSNNQLEVNCAGCSSSSEPVTGGLQIYSQGPSFKLGNNNYFAAAVLAPDASCTGGGNGQGGGGSNAQTDFFGSLICQDIGNQGGWEFHYDENLLNLASARLGISSYREETTNTSSFD